MSIGSEIMQRKNWWEKGWVEPTTEEKIRYLEKLFGDEVAVKCEKCDKYYTGYKKDLEESRHKYCPPCLNSEVMRRLHGKKPRYDKGKFY